MSWRTSDLGFRARSIGRAIGVNQLITSWLHGGNGYEAYDRQISSCIVPGDCVWDIGASTGYYTKLFAQRIGPQGSVVSFEPNPMKFRLLVEQCGNLNNVILLECGLGKSDGRFPFTTSKGLPNDARGVIVDIRSGDSLLAMGSVNVPNIVKLDVEGFEWGVLEGMKGVLARSCLRAIGIEVHFGILNTRRRERVPLQIERLLTDSGLTYRWTDSSHLIAVRKV